MAAHRLVARLVDSHGERRIQPSPFCRRAGRNPVAPTSTQVPPSIRLRWPSLGLVVPLLFAGSAAAAPGLGPERSFPVGDPFRNPGSATVGAVAHNEAGHAFVAGRNFPRSGPRVYVRERRGPRDGWGARVSLGPAFVPSSLVPLPPIAAINASGAGVVAFDRGGALVAFRRAGALGGWSEAGVASPSGATVRQIALDEAGRAVIVRSVVAGGCTNPPCVWTVDVIEQSAAGAAWTVATSVTTPPLEAKSGPEIAISRRGDVLVAWRGAGAVVTAVRKLATDAAFESPATVSAAGIVRLSAAIADNGDAGLAWTLANPPAAGTTPAPRVQVALRAAGAAGWGVADDVGASKGKPYVAVDVDGNAAAAWDVSSDTTGAAFRRAGTTAWQVTSSRRLAPPPFVNVNWVKITGSFSYSVDRIILERGTAFVGLVFEASAIGDDPGESFEAQGDFLSARDQLSGRWGKPISIELNESANWVVASAPNGNLLFGKDDLALKRYDDVADTAPPLPMLKGVRVVASGRRAVLRYSLKAGSVVWVQRTKAGSRSRVVAKRTKPAGRGAIDLGNLPRGAYRLKLTSCAPKAGCSPVQEIRFRRR